MKQRTKKTKRVLAWMLACMLLCSTVDNSLLSMVSHAEEADSAATATSGFCGAQEDGTNLTWSFDEKNGVLTISGSGKMEDYTERFYDGKELVGKKAPWDGFASQIRKVVFDGSEIEIGDCAFDLWRQYTALTEVTGWENITVIGTNAFYGTSVSGMINLISAKKLNSMAFGQCYNSYIVRVNSSCSIDNSGTGLPTMVIVKDGGSAGEWQERAVCLSKDERIVMLTKNLPVLKADCLYTYRGDSNGWYRLYYPEEEAESYSQWGKYQYYDSEKNSRFKDGEPIRIPLTHHEAKAASCSESGNKEYWSYTEDGVEKYFDEDGNDVESVEQFVIPKEPHQYDEIYTCTVCKQTAEALVTNSAGEVRGFEDLAEAFSYAMTQDGCTVKLWQDIADKEIYVLDKGKFTVDLSGKKITGSLQIGKDCDLTLENSGSENYPLSIIADSAGKLVTIGKGLLSDPKQFVIKDSTGEDYQTVIRDDTVWAAYAMDNISVLFKDSAKDTYTCVYSGEAQKPEMVVSYKGKTFEKDKDYTVDYDKNVAAGTAQVTLTGQNLLTGTVTVPFTIQPSKELPGTLQSTAIAVENTCKKVSAIALPEDWNWSEADKEKTLTAGKITEATAYYEGKDAANYQTTEYTIQITRAACEEEETILYTGEGEKEATCGQAGKGHTECSICHDVLRSDIVTAATGRHNYQWVIDKEATKEETGSKHEECTVCHDKKAPVIIEKLPSQPATSEESKQDATTVQTPTTETPKQDATTAQAPTTETSKQDATTAQTPTTEVSKQASTTEVFKDQTPAKKGKNLMTPSGISYRVTSTSKKNPTVSYQGGEKKTTVVIPEKVSIDGVTYKVTSIAKDAFRNNKKIKKVVIGRNITKIEDNAFKDCKNLTSIVIGKNVKTIGKQAFSGCKNLKTVRVKTTRLTKKSVGNKAFYGIDKEAVFTLPGKKAKSYKAIFKKCGAPKKAVYQ